MNNIMNDLTEITELNFSDNDSFGNKSSNFGGGIELLMNDKVKDNKPTSDINLDDLNNLEAELNGLVDEIPSNSFKPKSDFFSNPSVSFEDNTNFFSTSNNANSTNIGESTAQTENDTKTWDGYGKFNNIPLNPDKQIPLESKMSKEEILREKFKYLRK
jgi:hypothetical protein